MAIRRVYEQFKHLDGLLSDPDWLKHDHELWLAIKAAVKEMSGD